MTADEVSLDGLSQVIRDAGRPLHVSVLTRAAARARLQAGAMERCYAPGASYQANETLLFQGQRATVAAVQAGHNPAQGTFSVLTLLLPDGTQRLVAAAVPAAPAEDRQLVTEAHVDDLLCTHGTEVHQAVLAALAADPRFVSCQTPQGDLWCLADVLPQVRSGDVQRALAALPDDLEDGQPVSRTTEELVRAAWGLEDDGRPAYALHAFALSRALHGHSAVANLGGRWASVLAWEAFAARSLLETPQVATQVALPEGVAPATAAQVEQEQRLEMAGAGAEAEPAGPAAEDLETWRQGRPAHAVFTLRARHYYEGWLPLSGPARRLFPPLAAGRQEVVFHHHFGDEPASFRAWVDWQQGRIWASSAMYETFRRCRVYPGARLRISARSEREYDLATRETDQTGPIHVWRMWLDEDGRIQYEDDEEPRRYDVDDDVYVADVRFEDLGALFRQAEEAGNSIFGLMYRQACAWWQAGGRADLAVTAGQLFAAIHLSDQGRMTSPATVAWELWRRLAFEPLGSGRYRFRPEFGDRVRSVRPVPHHSHRHPLPSKPAPEFWAEVVRLTGRGLRTLEEGAIFDVLSVDDKAARIKIASTGREGAVYRQELEGMWTVLVQQGELRQAAMRNQYSQFKSAYIAAFLAALPGVTYQTKPVRLMYQSPPDEPPTPVPVVERTRSGQLVAPDLLPPGPLFEESSRPPQPLPPAPQIVASEPAPPTGPGGERPQAGLGSESRQPEEPTCPPEAQEEAVVPATDADQPAPAAEPPPLLSLPSHKPGPPAVKRGAMQTKALFSRHYLETRLPDHPEWSEDPRPACEAVRVLWEKACQYGDSWNEAQTENEFVRPVLEALGWSFIVQPKARHGGRVTRPDYALFADDAVRDAAYPYQGDDDPFYSRALAIAEAKYWGRPLSQMDASGRNTWKAASNPSHQMVSYLVGTRAPWGILTNGRVWRLYSREVSSVASEYYEIDLSAIFEPEPPTEPAPRTTHHETPLTAFKTFWLFFRRDGFLPDAQGRSFLQRVREGSTTYARQISDKLKELVFEQVMPEVTGGFVAYRYHELGVQEESEESLRAIYQASLSLLYKCLFILYAEARGLLPTANSGYREQSLTALAQWAAEHLERDLPLSDATHAATRYDALLALFHRIDRGDPSLGIPRYNGGLFNPASPENRFLEQHKLSDRAVARAVDTLVRDAGQPVDYAYLDVRNLGAIYEGLLENRLVVDRPQGSPETLEVSLVNDKGERKATGSYYTPDYIVEYIVQHTLDPLLEERDAAFRAAMDRCAGLRRKLRRVSDATTVRRLRGELDEAERDAREAFMGIKVLDPAMGSGHFLVNAVDHLTDAIILRMQIYHDEHPGVSWEWNPIQQLVERVREDILAEMERQGIRVDAERLNDTAILTRLVMKRCIYGVDLNPMAVELAKVSLWLHSFTIGAPLSFLDHHLRWGNSLIGTDVRTVEQALRASEQTQRVSKEARKLAEGRGEAAREVATVFQADLFGGPFAGLLDLTGLMTEVVERADSTLADVRQSAEDFDRFQKELTPYKQMLDLWVSQYFGNGAAKEFLTVHGADVLPALRGEKQVIGQYQEAIERARELWREKRFFHWDLEFPEVFVDLRRRDWTENPGFDAVVGNPPYVRSIRLKDADPEAWTYYAHHYYAAAKREFDVYLCFAEQGLGLLNSHGHFGMIMPNKWFTTQVGESLRSLLAERRATQYLVDFGHFQVFEGVTTYTCLLFLGRLPHDAAGVAILEEAEDNARPLPGGGGRWQTGVVRIENLGADMWAFGIGPTGALLDKLGRLPRLESIATVFKGTGTSADQVFLMRRQGDHFYSRSLEQWVELEDDIMRPSLTGRDIDPYYYVTDNYLLFPYRLAGEEAHLIPAEEMAAKYPQAWAYLSHPTNRESLGGRDKAAFRDRGDWYAYGRPQNMHLLGLDKIVGPDVAGRAEFACDLEGRHIIDTVYAIRPNPGLGWNLRTLAAILNSRMLTFFLQQTGTVLRGGYFRMKTAYLNPFPVSSFTFTTPPDERARLVGTGITEAAEWTERAERAAASVSSSSFSAFSGSLLGRWLDARLTADPEQADTAHDLLAHLAEAMITLNKDKQAETRGFLGWLAREIGAPLDDLTHKTRLQRYLGDYQKGEAHLTLDELLDILRANRRRLQVDPSARAFQERLEQEYAASLGKLLPLKARLAATDRLIDLIVYRLYGLTEEEVATVEHKGG